MTWPGRLWHIVKGTPRVNTPYGVLQANLQRKKLATNELFIEATKRGVAVALLQEPYVAGAGVMKSHRGVRIFQNTGIGGGTVKAAIAVFNSDLVVKQYPKLTTNNISVVGILTSAWEITFVSFYCEPDQPIEPYLEHLRQIGLVVGSGKLIVGGDANAKNIWWGSPKNDHRGEEMVGTLGELGLNILNRGEIPTFDTIRGGKRYSSYVDVTACSNNILDQVDDWRIDEGLTSSDHNGIAFNILLEKSKGIKIERTTRKFNTKKANWSEFHLKFGQLKIDYNITVDEIIKIKNKHEIDIITNNLNKAIDEACTLAIPNKKVREELTLPWWSERLAGMKRTVTTMRRRIRCAAPVRRQKVVDQYLKQKEEYELEVAKAQTESWKEFCGKQDREGVWEGIYRVIGRTQRREEDLPLEWNGDVLDAKGSVKLLAETFYPDDSPESDNLHHRSIRSKAENVNLGEQHDCCDPPFTMAELRKSVESFNPKKAPGSDGFTADICREVVGNDPILFLGFLNKCFELQCFPASWKEATVVILRKPGKDNYSTPKSYRPIGLLPILGKIYEKMLVARLKFHLLPRMSTRQYGFMPQRSTEDSLYALMQHVHQKLAQKKIITLVSLDIEGAFDNAWWPAVRVRLAEEKCPVNLRRVIDGYLSDRKVSIRYGGEIYTKGTSKGCVQGSIGGPILWNLLLDPLLKALQSGGIYIQAFADDVLLVFDGETALEVEVSANAALARVLAWGVENKLAFAPHKTTAMVITRKLKFDTPRLSMGGTDIALAKEMKILGVTIDSGLTFNTHVSLVCRRAIEIYKRLCRAAKVSWGLHPDIVRIIYVATIEPIILYAASVWAPAAEKLGIKKQLRIVQRGIAQKMCRAYRTVSLNSALVLTGMLPLDLRVREAAALYGAKRGVPQPVLGGREVERMAPALEAPHPAEQMCLEFGSLVDEDQYNNHSNYAVRIFTDGSKIEGKVGAALSLWNGAVEAKALKFALPSYCTVYQAELLALQRAVGEVLKHSETTFGIFSDSMAALQSVTNSSSPHPLAVETRDALRRCKLQNKCVSLFWIKAHAGLEGNERADQLAKEAALGSKKRPDYDQCPVSFVKRVIRLETLGEWNGRYRSGDTASGTKIFFPDAVAAYGVVRKMTHDSLTTQILTGHGGFSAYLKRFKCKEDPSCACEPGVEETVLHILFNCPITVRMRYETEQQLGVELNVQQVPHLMTGKNREMFLNYCSQIASIVVKRNKTV